MWDNPEKNVMIMGNITIKNDNISTQIIHHYLDHYLDHLKNQ